MANEPVDLIPMPAALLAFRLRSRLGCQKQAGIGHWGRSAKNKLSFYYPQMPMKIASIALAFYILFCGPIFCQAESPKPPETDWQLYSPGAFPQGWILPVDRIVDAYGKVDRLYLVGDFTVTAAEQSRCILRNQEYADFRFIVEFPKGMHPPSENETITRTPLRPLLVTSMKIGPDGQTNVYLHEIIK